jgi:hypothetical protein
VSRAQFLIEAEEPSRGAETVNGQRGLKNMLSVSQVGTKRSMCSNGCAMDCRAGCCALCLQDADTGNAWPIHGASVSTSGFL